MNRSRPAVNGALPMEWVVAPDGSRTEVDTSGRPPYSPVQREWFKLGTSSDGVRWMEPYTFTDGAWGISAVRGVRWPGHGPDALLADFFLRDVTRFVRAIRVGTTGRVLLVTGNGKLIGLGPDDAPRRALFDGALAERARAGVSPDRESLHSFDSGGVVHRAAFTSFRLNGLDWLIAIVAPERELTGIVEANARTTLLAGLAALLFALAVATFLAARISRPIHRMSRDLQNVSKLELSDERSPGSFVREISALGESIDRMKAGLRSFERYVPADVVRELVASGIEARLVRGFRNTATCFLHGDSP